MERLFDYLTPVYKAESARIISELQTYMGSLLHKEPSLHTPHWYKQLSLYSVYPDGVSYDEKLSPLRNLAEHVPHIQQLGFNAIHILPFLESPLIDKGFDVSDYYLVRSDLGTMQDLLAVKAAADKAGIHLFMDLVLNHVSDQHAWFKLAQQGDEKYRNYFIVTDGRPNFIRKFHHHSAVWAEYNVDDKIIAVNIAFPEYTGEIPHWRQGADGSWYYHTYYPQQLDLNWQNADVFIEIAKVMIYWASYGFSFRLDALPFVGKSAYKMTDVISSDAVLITAALKLLVHSINPNSTFLVESFESINTVISYFGTRERVQAELSYNFHLSTSIWTSIVKQDVSFIWQKIDKQKQIPEHAEWLTFLRNHDELSLAHLSNDVVEDVNKKLLKLGKNFREGFGISGRTFSLLNRSKKKFLMAYFLLASLPGSIMLPYGDEIAAVNISLSKLSSEERKDTRNINRGKFLSTAFKNQHPNIQQTLTYIFAQRKQLKTASIHNIIKIDIAPDIFAAGYGEEILIYINLSATKRVIHRNFNNYHLLAHVNRVHISSKHLELGPYAGIWIKLM